MRTNNIKFISICVGLILIVLLVVVIFPNTFSKFSNTKVLSGTIKVNNNTISNYLKNTNDLENDNTKDSNLRYKNNINNYIKIDNHLYQIIGIFNNNIKVIDTISISIDELDNYYDNLSINTKSIIIESTYYNGKTNSKDFIKAYEEEKTNSIKSKINIMNISDSLYCDWLEYDEINIKPVFHIDGNVSYLKGKGTKNDPYVV